MYEKLESCPLCGSEQFTNYMICKDFAISQEDFALVICQQCEFIFTNPRPDSDSLFKYYDSDEYISHQDRGNTLINKVYRVARMFTLNQKLKLISKYCRKGNVLDVGCGTGHFLSICNKSGYSTTGVEPNDTARQQAINKNIGPVFSDIKQIPSNEHSYDIITLWHVLEHVPNLKEFSHHLKKLLAPKGQLIIAVPNINSFDAKHYKHYWAALDVPRHLYHFSQKTMSKYLNINDLRLIDTRPMKLDSYYVSMLSEKYQNNGKNNYLRAVANGFKSNTFAINNNNNYSSLIYIAKNK